jgi:RimJ/RimL family protein N-acetyltransferase
MTAFEIPTLRTPRLTLRAFRATDWDPFAAMEAREEVQRYRGGKPLSREQAWDSIQFQLGQWALRGYGRFALERVADGRFIGCAGILHPLDWTEPELAYSVDQPYWGEGLATEAAAAARNWAFATLGLPRLVSYIFPENIRSQRVAAKLGAVRDGPVDLRGAVVDSWIHAAPPYRVTA